MVFRFRMLCVLSLGSVAALLGLGCRSASKSAAVGSARVVHVSSTVPARAVNVVVITLDTVRADHLRCYGYKKIQTPVIDGLAAGGVLFERAVTQTPLTAPSHASIFTGLNPNVHGVRDTGGFGLKPEFETLAAILKNGGWDTAGFVSAPVLAKQFGFNQGFAVYDDQMPPQAAGTGAGYSASRPANLTVDRAVNWLNGQHGRPFFVWLHLYDAHQPYAPPAEFARRYPRDPYDAEIAFEDRELGRFLAAVDRKAPRANTLIVLLSDHGEGLGEHGEQGHGIFLYDSTVRIADIMAGPGVPAGVRVNGQAREIDVLPTIVALLGGKASQAVQGVSLTPMFAGGPVAAANDSYEETLYPKINMGWSELRGIHTGRWMYVRAPKPELYDLENDPGELHNVIAAQPKEFRALDARLKQAIGPEGGAAETVATSHADRQTLEQLKSLGYVGSSDVTVKLNGQGPDAKDMLPVLRIVDQVTGLGSETLTPARMIALLEQGVKLDPGNPLLYSMLGDMYQKTGQKDMALNTYTAALHHGIQNETLFARLGDLYTQSGNRQEAILFLKQAQNLNPGDAENSCNLAQAYLDNGQYDEGEQLYRAVIASQPYPKAYNGLGRLETERHNPAAARADFERAVQLDPDYPEARYDLGVACDEVRDFACERSAFQAFLAKAAGGYLNLVPRAEYHLGTACRELHDVACARSAWNAFLVNTPPEYEKLEPQVREELNALQ